MTAPEDERETDVLIDTFCARGDPILPVSDPDLCDECSVEGLTAASGEK